MQNIPAAEKPKIRIPDPPNHHQGKCRKCGAEFYGPRNRKYCDDHSRSVHYMGRG